MIYLINYMRLFIELLYVFEWARFSPQTFVIMDDDDDDDHGFFGLFIFL